MGIWVMALPGAQPITSPIVGFTAEAAGPRAGFGLAGAALLLVAAAGWRSLADAGVATEPAAGVTAAPDRSRRGSGRRPAGSAGSPAYAVIATIRSRARRARSATGSGTVTRGSIRSRQAATRSRVIFFM